MAKIVTFPGMRIAGEVGDPSASPLRWLARIEYRSEAGGELAFHHFEEFDELADIIERGPHWDTIVKVSVTVNRADEDPNLTIEGAQLL